MRTGWHNSFIAIVHETRHTFKVWTWLSIRYGCCVYISQDHSIHVSEEKSVMRKCDFKCCTRKCYNVPCYNGSKPFLNAETQKCKKHRDIFQDIEWGRTFWIAKTPTSQELIPSINRLDYMNIKCLFIRGNNEQSTQIPTEWEEIWTRDTVERGSYLEFTNNFRN